MKINQLPHYDMSVNTTDCCARFNLGGWDDRRLHFRDKKFIRAHSLSAMHIPLNMGSIFSRVQKHIDEADAFDDDDFVVMSKDLSPWTEEHLFSVTKDVPHEQIVTLTGEFVTKVFEGPYSNSKDWYIEMKEIVEAMGSNADDIYFFYTTCPKCAKAYGQNYVVGIARI